MKWKEIIIGSLLTLIVTIIAGIATYYFTKEPETKNNEDLYFSIKELSSFSSENQQITIAPIELTNRGGIVASDVKINVEFEESIIKDYDIQSDNNIEVKEINIEKNLAKFSFDSIASNETITISFLVTKSSKPKVSLRSKKTIGKDISLIKDASLVKEKINKFLSASISIV